MPATTTPTIASAIPATIALATAIVLGQCSLPGEPKLATLEGEAGRDRDQGQGCAAGQQQADYGGARVGY
jgi:hypothetical protein